MVLLHAPDAPSVQGVARYSRGLGQALQTLGEPVRFLRLRPRELQLGHRRFGGFLSMRAQAAFRPWSKRDVLHSTFHLVAHPRCDVATVHDLFSQTWASLLGVTAPEVRAMDRGLGRLATRKTRLVCVSAHTRDALLERAPAVDPDRVHVIHPGVDAAFRPPDPETVRTSPVQRPFRILCVSDLNPRKRLDWLLEAAHSLGDRDVEVVHVGPSRIRRKPWAKQTERERAWEARLGRRFRRLGMVAPEDLLAQYQAADLLVLPSLDEGFGYPPLEALSCGTPVAVSDIPVFRETLGDQAGFFSDADGLAKVLGQAIAEGPPTPQQRRANHAWVQSRYDWKDCAARTLAVYERVRAT